MRSEEHAMEKKLKIAVLTEWHPIDVVAFQKLFENFPDFECYIQSLEMFVKDEKNNGIYDAVVYYNLSRPLLTQDSKIYQYFTEKLGSTKQGIFLLHHAILCYPGWELWDQLTGLADRKFKFHWNQTVDFHIQKVEHPITKDLKDWQMVDETYTLEEPTREGSQILVTADHPVSIHNIAWTRQYNSSRVFCYASGHDEMAYNNESFRKVLHRGILWCANQI
jgi:hypothetical protein